MNNGHRKMSKEEIQRELDLRGSEVKMADSLESKDAVKESGKSRRSHGLVVHQERSITSTASAEETPLGFQPMTEDMEDELTLPAVEAWLCELSVIGRCPDLAAKAADYAYQFVEEDGLTRKKNFDGKFRGS